MPGSDDGSPVTDPDLIGLFVEPLERLSIPYMITGGVASVVYGDPRFTRDIDLVVELEHSGVTDFVGAFPSDEFYVPPEKVVHEEISRLRGGHFNVIHQETALRADIYLVGTDALHAWAFDRRRRLSVEDLPMWLAPMEYVVLRKLQYYRDSGSDRHLRDIAAMVRISGHRMDRAEVERRADALDLREELDRALDF